MMIKLPGNHFSRNLTGAFRPTELLETERDQVEMHGIEGVPDACIVHL